MSFNCGQCLSKCKADCCRGPVPMPKALLDRFPHVRKIVMQEDIGDGMVIVTGVDETTWQDDGKGGKAVVAACPFLGLDYKCTIYDHRPEVCREFGSESHPFMVCSFQDKDGRVRSRQERRNIGRQQVKLSEARIATYSRGNINVKMNT